MRTLLTLACLLATSLVAIAPTASAAPLCVLGSGIDVSCSVGGNVVGAEAECSRPGYTICAGEVDAAGRTQDCRIVHGVTSGGGTLRCGGTLGYYTNLPGL